MEDYHKGLWQTIKDGKELRILAVGPKMIDLALKVSDKLEIDTEVVAVRSVKPLDEKYLTDIPIVTLEENVLNGGFGSTVSTYYTKKGISPKVLSFGVDDVFVDHASIEKQLIDNGLTEANIISKIKKFI
jgi:1-deoxy-D-xylulose-5-phosphate synthase